jgi:GNAT superfamily N-acetyltransferase
MPITLLDLDIEDADHGKFDCSSFDCSDADLNDFLKSDCPRYRDHRLSYTKIALLKDTTTIVGYVALLADSISLETSERQWLISKNVHIQHIPALKVGRLAISKDFQRKGIGQALMKYSVGIAFRIGSDLNVGCRFITVDAYPASIEFYERIGFVRSMHKNYKKRKQPSMHYDLIQGKPL